MKWYLLGVQKKWISRCLSRNWKKAETFSCSVRWRSIKLVTQGNWSPGIFQSLLIERPRVMLFNALPRILRSRLVKTVFRLLFGHIQMDKSNLIFKHLRVVFFSWYNCYDFPAPDCSFTFRDVIRCIIWRGKADRWCNPFYNRNNKGTSLSPFPKFQQFPFHEIKKPNKKKPHKGTRTWWKWLWLQLMMGEKLTINIESENKQNKTVKRNKTIV